MTQLSFRVDQAEAEHVKVWAERLGIDRAHLLRTAVRNHLQALESEIQADTWVELLASADGSALREIADCCPGLEGSHRS